MGLTWILGFLSGFTEWEWLWYPFVIFNGLQGTFIFVAFDCKSKIWNMVMDKFGWTRGKARMGGEISSSDLKRRGTTTLSSTMRSSSTRTSKTTGGRQSMMTSTTVISSEGTPSASNAGGDETV